MKVIVLGATGNTGLELVKQSLQRGHETTAIVRDPTKLQTIKDKNLKVITCNLLDANELATHFAGHDCILSALGSPGFTLFRVTFVQESIRAIVEAMRKTNLKRIIIVGSQYTKPGLQYPTFYTLLLRPMIGRQLDALNEMEDYLFNECSNDIDFTVVRPPRLLDTPLSDETTVAGVDQFFFNDGSTAGRLSRANVAKYMLDILDSNEHVKKGVAIDAPKQSA